MARFEGCQFHLQEVDCCKTRRDKGRRGFFEHRAVHAAPEGSAG